jgi:hypothetical protein
MNIWYIEFMDSWATTDKTGALHIWDIALNKVINSYYVTGEIKKENNNGEGNDPHSLNTSIRDKAKSLMSVTTIKKKEVTGIMDQSAKNS